MSAIGFGMKSLVLCFVFNSLFSDVAAAGVVLDLVFLPYRSFDLSTLRGRILNSQQQAREKLENHLNVFEALHVDLKC